MRKVYEVRYDGATSRRRFGSEEEALDFVEFLECHGYGFDPENRGVRSRDSKVELITWVSFDTV